MDNQPEQIDYGKVLADLEAKRDAIDRTIQGIKQMLGQSPTSTTAPAVTNGHGTVTELRSDSFFGMPIPEACKAYLRISKQTKRTVEIAEAIQHGGVKTTAKNFLPTVHTALNRLMDQGEVVKVKRGEWGLAEWYPGLRGKKGTKSVQAQLPSLSEEEVDNIGDGISVEAVGES